jgi:hypothetical protein
MKQPLPSRLGLLFALTLPLLQGRAQDLQNAATPTPAAQGPVSPWAGSSAQAHGPNDQPGMMIDTFFLALKANQVEAGYDGLVKDSIIADRAQDVASLKEKTKQALDNYGPISGYELVNEKDVGTTLMRRTFISLNEDIPLRWRFYFYKPGKTWKLIDLRVDDGLVELFDEVTQRQPQQ